jgi:hypothetical protein
MRSKWGGTGDALDEFNHLFPVELLIALHVTVLDEPVFELRVAPGRPYIIGDVVVVMFHLLGEGGALCVVCVRDQAVCDEPFALDLD